MLVLTHKAQGEYQGTIAQSTPPYPQRRRARHAATSSPLSLLQNPSPLPKRERPDHRQPDWIRKCRHIADMPQKTPYMMEAYKLGPKNSQGFRTSHCVTFCLGNVGVPGHIMTLNSTYTTMCKFRKTNPKKHSKNHRKNHASSKNNFSFT